MKLWAFAAALAVMAGSAGLTGHAQTEKKKLDLAKNGLAVQCKDTVYFGLESYKRNGFDSRWTVLDPCATNTGSDGMFLVFSNVISEPNSPGAQGDVVFDNTRHPNSSAYQGSDVQKWCADFFEESFTDTEKSAVIATFKDDTECDRILNGDRMFLLSRNELMTYLPTKRERNAVFHWNGGQYYLRTPASIRETESFEPIPYVECVCSGGEVAVQSVAFHHTAASRPAFNLDTRSVLFASAASGGKISGETGAECLAENKDYGGDEWKLTLLDQSRDLDVRFKGIEDDVITFKYSGAEVGDNEFISALITDAGGEIRYYGRIAEAVSSVGTLTLDVKDKLAADDVLYIFNEQCNGDKVTDISGSLVKLDVERPVTKTNKKFIAADIAAAVLIISGIVFTMKKRKRPSPPETAEEDKTTGGII